LYLSKPQRFENKTIYSDIYIFSAPLSAQTVRIYDLKESICPRKTLFINCDTGIVKTNANNALDLPSNPYAEHMDVFYVKLMDFRKLNPCKGKWYKSDTSYYNDLTEICFNFLMKELPKDPQKESQKDSQKDQQNPPPYTE